MSLGSLRFPYTNGGSPFPATPCVLLRLMNKLQPGSIPKINRSMQNWHQVRDQGERSGTRMGLGVPI